MFIEPADAVKMAREKAGQPHAPAGIAENEEGYLVSFDDGVDHVATMTKVWWWVDKATGEVSPVGASVVARLSDTLRSLDL